MKELAALLLLLAMCLVILSAVLSGPRLPNNAYKVRALGNNWSSFCLDQKRYIHHAVPGRYSSTESTTRIPEEDSLCK